MTTSEVLLEADGCLIVQEGPARLRWERIDALEWRITGVWPDDSERRAIAGRLADARPILVVVGSPQAIPVLREEWRGAPPGLIVDEVPEADVVDLLIPPLDWLPDGLRQRGMSFLEQSTRLVRERPRLLLPPVILDDPPTGHRHVRFARRTTGQPLARRDLLALARCTFAGPDLGDAAARSAPGARQPTATGSTS